MSAEERGQKGTDMNMLTFKIGVITGPSTSWITGAGRTEKGL